MECLYSVTYVSINIGEQNRTVQGMNGPLVLLAWQQVLHGLVENSKYIMHFLWF